MDNTILVSRTLSDGRQLEIRTAPVREVITTIGGVVQPGLERQAHGGFLDRDVCERTLNHI